MSSNGRQNVALTDESSPASSARGPAALLNGSHDWAELGGSSRCRYLRADPSTQTHARSVPARAAREGRGSQRYGRERWTDVRSRCGVPHLVRAGGGGAPDDRTADDLVREQVGERRRPRPRPLEEVVVGLGRLRPGRVRRAPRRATIQPTQAWRGAQRNARYRVATPRAGGRTPRGRTG
jgi:hypothetical protein